jgi:para-nitrobenzyl esterase
MRGRFFAPFVVAACVSLGGARDACALVPIPGDPVVTSQGKLAGTRLDSGVKAYLGVPYAAAPVRGLRWKPPQPAKWDGVWVADRKGPECIQVLRPHNINHYFGEEPTGEDCLYLNIWVPAGAQPNSQLPVIVFIYGGGGTIGSSGIAIYGGEQVAREGAVFVNFNYRVGALGFMAHPELTKEQGGHSGNYGYLDQNAALRWIHDNIAAFGGDPQKVVITGQSFGAGSVAAQLFSPLSKGLFRAAAMWSACNFKTSGPDLATAEQAGLELQKRLGAASLEDLRNIPADRILAAQSETQVGVNVRGIRTPPLIDGYFTVADKATLLAKKEVNDVPIIASSNGDDLDANQSPLTRAKTVAEFQRVARELYGANADQFLRLFPVKSDADVYAAAHAAARESGMLEASRTCAQLQSQATKSRAYVGLFDHKHPYVQGVKIADQNPLTIGAYHTADVPYWFGTLDAFNLFRPTRAWTAEDRKLSDTMLHSLIAFADSGTPKLNDVAWPAWNKRDEAYVVFAETPKAEKLPTARMDWLASHAPATPPAAAAPATAPTTGPRD